MLLVGYLRHFFNYTTEEVFQMSNKQLNINIQNLNSLLKLKYGDGSNKTQSNVKIKEHRPELNQNIEKSLENKKVCDLDLFAMIINNINKQ